MSELPRGWTSARLGALTTKVGSGATPKGGAAAYQPTGTPLIRSMNVVFFGFKRDGLAHLDEAQAEALTSAEVHAHDVLLNITGASIGRATLAPADLSGARVNQHVCIIRPVQGLDPRFLSAYLSSPTLQGLIANENYGVTRQALTKQQILDFEIPIAPLPEQKRIADKLDALIARVDACRERLDRVPGILKRFRQAVLAAATTGELTREWREERGRTFDGWTSTTVGQIITRVEAGLNVKCDERPPTDGERGLVKISAVTWGTYNDDESKTLPSTAVVPEQARIRLGDFLISRANTLELVGACVIVHHVTRPVFLSDKVLRLVMPDELKPWLHVALQSSSGRLEIETRASGNQLSMRNLSQDGLRAVPVPMPPPDERAEILRRVAALLDRGLRLGDGHRKADTKLQRLTPAILAKAFRGSLVPQDPSDEPATTLLARLRSDERSTPGAAVQVGRRRRRSRPA